jgi:hypothetical protein
MEWIDIQVLNIYIKIGIIGLTAGIISAGLTESEKITCATVFSKEHATPGRFSWRVNLALVLVIAHISTSIFHKIQIYIRPYGYCI